MDNTSCTTNGTCHDCLISILLTLDLHILIDSDGAKPVVRVIITIVRLRMNYYTFDVC